jgi:hypothetical protein
MSFISTPAGDVYNVARIGGVKAVETGLLIFGNGQDEILEYAEVPGGVAALWRDELVALLSSHRPNRPVRQLDWLELGATVDPKWAGENGWTGPAPAAVTPVSASPTPFNRPTPVSAVE